MKTIYPFQRKIATEVVAALVAGGLSLAGSLGTTGASLGATGKLNKKNRKWQEKMYDLQVENNREDAETTFERQKELQALGVESGLRVEREKWGANVQGLREAGLNPMLALNGGVGGAGGVSAPSSSQAHSASIGAPQTFAPQILDPTAQMADIIANAELKASEADLNKAKKNEVLGDTPLSQETINKLKEDVKKTAAEAELTVAETKLTNLKSTFQEIENNWQTIQNNIAEATEKYQIDAIKWQLYNTRKNYEVMCEELKNWKAENQKKTEFLEAQIRLFNQQASLAFANGELAETTKGLTDEERRKKEKETDLFIMMMPDIHQKYLWETKNEAEFRERFEELLRNQRRGQNLQFTGQIISSIVGSATSLYKGRKMIQQMGKPKTTEYGEFDRYGDYIPTSWKRESERGLGL